MPDIPLGPGTAEQFAAVRSLLATHQFAEEPLNQRLNAAQLSQDEPKHEFAQPVEAEDALDALAVLFVRGRSLRRELFDQLLGAEAYDALTAVGLVAGRDGGLCYATVRVSPIRSLYVVSDRWSHPDGSPFEMFDDIVYPADVKNVRDLLSFLPQTSCRTMLDVCAGTGIFSLDGATDYAAQHAHC